MNDTNNQLLDLLKLKPGWDSYGSAKIHPVAVSVARRVLRTFDSVAAIVPCSDGGVQLEWHTGGLDIEIKIAPDATVEILVEESENTTRRARRRR